MRIQSESGTSLKTALSSTVPVGISESLKNLESPGGLVSKDIRRVTMARVICSTWVVVEMKKTG